jgi:hypothetical protein
MSTNTRSKRNLRDDPVAIAPGSDTGDVNFTSVVWRGVQTNEINIAYSDALDWFVGDAKC